MASERAGLLHQAGQRVVFAENGDHRTALAGLAHHRGFDAGDVLGDPESVLAEHRCVRGSGANLVEIGLRRVKNRVGQALERLAMAVDNGPNGFLITHFRSLGTMAGGG